MNVTKSSDIWMLGDTWMDIKSAQNAGVKSVALLSGYGDLETLSQHTELIKNSALEAVEYIKQDG